MNVYDFDDTIYKGDSSKDFLIYIAFHHPVIMLKELPGQFWTGVLYLTGQVEKKKMKEQFFHFILSLKNLEDDVSNFWDMNQYKIKKWYLDQKESDDVIISASPVFLLQDICDRLQISHLIATDIDIQSGRIQGENCKGQEKVSRFYDRFPQGKIERFYSDSYSDKYLAAEAEKSYLVKKDMIEEWKV